MLGQLVQQAFVNLVDLVAVVLMELMVVVELPVKETMEDHLAAAVMVVVAEVPEV
jgi:hypothetical protein